MIEEDFRSDLQKKMGWTRHVFNFSNLPRAIKYYLFCSGYTTRACQHSPHITSLEIESYDIIGGDYFDDVSVHILNMYQIKQASTIAFIYDYKI